MAFAHIGVPGQQCPQALLQAMGVYADSAKPPFTVDGVDIRRRGAVSDGHLLSPWLIRVSRVLSLAPWP